MLPVYFAYFVIGLLIFIRNLIERNLLIFTYAMIPGVVAACIPALIILSHHANSLRYSGEFIPIITLLAIYSIDLFIRKIDVDLQRIKNLNLFKQSIKFIFYFV